MPSDLALKAMNGIHRAILAASFGKIGWNAGNMPVLELVTRGRKSGEPRAVMLTSPLQEGNDIVIVASRGGDDIHPAWYLNIVADPRVKVRYKGGPLRDMNARLASGDERARMWPLVTSKYKNYAAYQSKTDREIPLVILSPAS